MANQQLLIYGTLWCGDCHRVRRFLDGNKITYRWIDIDLDQAAEKIVLEKNRGMRSVPTIIFPDGSLLVEPSEYQLARKLEEMHI